MILSTFPGIRALVHNKPGAPRFDVISDRARLVPEDTLQRRDRIGGNAGYLYADDAAIAGGATLGGRKTGSGRSAR